jgi:hypothetical protein
LALKLRSVEELLQETDVEVAWSCWHLPSLTALNSLLKFVARPVLCSNCSYAGAQQLFRFFFPGQSRTWNPLNGITNVKSAALKEYAVVLALM